MCVDICTRKNFLAWFPDTTIDQFYEWILVPIDAGSVDLMLVSCGAKSAKWFLSFLAKCAKDVIDFKQAFYNINKHTVVEGLTELEK